ncbi:MFS transporter [Agarivorans sp. B2Z047]|uniref:L-lactate MFS transporter n=1 Tax=Agarivorans sp. B2Z047 TaxID=2652721 RepID=UPI00128D14DD|nr:OFA family MFS transporter [Agarivorans sp. B2Z047]MPW30855.1 MFS transporter [Agarivorans sp. B2Z047]UQN40914.1 OFA family MFS transporter [Agarivorans sp. B2Z047]
MKNRWLIAASAVGLHASIGSVYAFSVFKKPLGQLLESATNNEIAWTFSFAIFFLGLSAAIMGHFVEKNGPRKAGMLAAAFFGGGLLIAGFGAYIQNLYLIWLGYGVLGGIGLGIGYITPVSTLVKWFPDRRGLATGLAIMGFGFGAMVAGPVFNFIIETFTVEGNGIAYTWWITGVVYLVIMFASASYLERPPQGWMPDAMKAAVESGEKKVVEDLTQLTANEAVKTGPFYGLWVMMFINISCGIAVIYAASPLAQESIGLSPAEAAGVVGLMSLFNGLGRIAWASLSDVLGRPNTYMIFFLIQIVAFCLLPNITSIILFQVVLYTILTCYGGGFATLPAFIGDLFGTKELSAIHGYVLTAWALAGLAGPQIAAYVKTTTGSYEMTLYIFAGVFVIALIASLLMKSYMTRARAEMDVAAQTAHA